jgi:hypothetical protein
VNKLERNESIREAYFAGASLQECGDAHGLTLEGARQVLIRLGIPLRRRGRPRMKRKPRLNPPAEVVEMLRAREPGEPHPTWTNRCAACLRLLGDAHECPA